MKILVADDLIRKPLTRAEVLARILGEIRFEARQCAAFRVPA